MLYVSHPVADIFKPLIICLELGTTIDANRKSFWASYSGNPTIEEGYEQTTCINRYGSTNARCNLLVF